ncbi:hypothetical protein F0562_012336 [Nyssa sinensis]|uniref:Uncharacterized protein n=1 Tax=Nyssa sinensis TaxID=561372 RepID=A0A5J4ZUW2_9ASTE|nr:hypothetical protein F0562_012336 [Nyssa sinensis]
MIVEICSRAKLMKEEDGSEVWGVKVQEQLCFEHSKQSKIFVYGSGQSEQRYDPDPPPELATTTGIRDLLPENLSGKTDVRKSELLHKGLGAANELSPTPIGSAIPVEVGVGERLPSVDSNRPRLRNSDAIIEIVLLDSVDEKDIDGEDFKEDIAQMDTKHCSFLHHNCKMQSSTIRKNIYGDRVRPFPLDGSYQYWPGFELSAGIFGTFHEERKKLESHSWSDCDRNPGPRHGRTADTSTDLCKCLDNLHTRRRKDEEHVSGEKAKKEEFLHCYRTQKDSSRKQRERDVCLDERKDKRRLRCGPDYHHSDEHREESWHQKGRNDRPRLKQTPEDNQSKRVREVRRTGSYQSSCSDCSANRFDSEMNIAEHKKIRMKSNGFKRVQKNIPSPSKRKKYDHGSYSNEKVSMEGSNEQASEKSLKTVPTDSCDSGQLKSSSSAAFTKKCHHGQQIPKDCHSSRKQREDASSSNSQRHSKRGRSKLERWTSNDEDSVDSLDSQTCVDEERVAGDLNIQIGEDAEKLKKQNKMPNVKDLRGNRTMESKSTAMIQNETAADSEIKHECPARKRKWVGS